jgi:hypothetical protein
MQMFVASANYVRQTCDRGGYHSIVIWVGGNHKGCSRAAISEPTVTCSTKRRARCVSSAAQVPPCLSQSSFDFGFADVLRRGVFAAAPCDFCRLGKCIAAQCLVWLDARVDHLD